MYERRTSFAKESKLKYFLLVTAKNLSINRLKANKYHLPYSDDIEGEKEEVGVSIYLEKFKEVLDEKEYQVPDDISKLDAQGIAKQLLGGDM